MPLRLLIFTVVVLVLGSPGQAQQQYPVTGIVLEVDLTHQTFVVSHGPIPGLMGAMAMRFNVRNGNELKGLAVGMTVAFSMVLEKSAPYAEGIQIRLYEAVQQDPLTARRLTLLEGIASSPSSRKTELTNGQLVSDFTLTNHHQRAVTLSRLRGKVVAINFIYTSCPLPDFCLRITNNFAVLQKRFAKRMGSDLVLLTVSFDPAHDTPEALARYASQWNADPNWHFLTGPVNMVRQVSSQFGVDSFPDEGLMNHSLHTALIDRRGRMAANIEGNQFTAEQLGDLTETLLDGRALRAR